MVRPLPDDHLDGFQADFSLLLRAGLFDPDQASALGAGRLSVEDEFDHSTAPKAKLHGMVLPNCTVDAVSCCKHLSFEKEAVRPDLPESENFERPDT